MGIWYDKKAYELLKKCSDAKDLTEWNEYRKVTNYSPINLRFADIRNFYLQKAELQNIDLRGASLEKADFNFADVRNLNISSDAFLVIYLIGFSVGFGIVLLSISSGYSIVSLIVGTSMLGAFLGFVLIVSLIAYVFSKYARLANMISFIVSAITMIFIGCIVELINSTSIIEIVSILTNDLSESYIVFIAILNAVALVVGFASTIAMIFGSELYEKPISSAKNPDKAVGFRRKYLQIKPTNIAEELQKEASEIGKAIEASQDDDEKQKLVFRQKELEEKIDFFTKQEIDTRIQQTRIENVISELQIPYIYIHKTIAKIEWHNRIYYSVIFGLLALFLYSIVHGYIDQKMATFTSLFSKEILPSFGTIFGVILFYGTPVLIGISLIIYFIAQINKNIDKITELQEQDRNIKQIASTIKAKAQIGMSDEEFVKDTKSLIQKYQEGMMIGMFNKEKTSDKDEKSTSLTYREKIIANGITKLLMQALKK